MKIDPLGTNYKNSLSTLGFKAVHIAARRALNDPSRDDFTAYWPQQHAVFVVPASDEKTGRSRQRPDQRTPTPRLGPQTGALLDKR